MTPELCPEKVDKISRSESEICSESCLSDAIARNFLTGGVAIEATVFDHSEIKRIQCLNVKSYNM